MALIQNVTPKSQYRIHVQLANGRDYDIDMSSKIKTCRFSSLSDAEYFSHVTTDGMFIIWGNGETMLSASELYLNAI